MSDELKSAWELAMERLGMGQGPVEKLSQEQKAAIADARRRCQAKIAEAEIGADTAVRKAIQSGNAEQVETIRRQLAEEKARFARETEAEIERIRAGQK
jgi:hypothetical protein